MASFRTNRIRRILWTSAVLVGISTVAIVAPLIFHAAQERRAAISSQVRPILATDIGQSEIIRVVFKSRHGLLIPPGSHSKPLVVTRTVAICEPAVGDDGVAAYCSAMPSVDAISNTDLDAAIPRSLRMELIAANARPTRLLDGRWDRATLSSYSTVGEALQDTESWEQFYKIFPNSIGLVEFSRAVISRDGNHALIYMGHYAGGLAGVGSLHYLTRRGEAWIVSSVVGVWRA